MRLVIDTNVLVSAVLKDRDPELVILHVVGTPGAEWVVTPEILAEYHAVLRRPRLGIPEDVLAAWATLIERATTRVTADIPAEFPPDPADAKFLACAIAAGADYLITGDRALREPLRAGPTAIVSVAQFMQLISKPSGP